MARTKKKKSSRFSGSEKSVHILFFNKRNEQTRKHTTKMLALARSVDMKKKEKVFFF